MRCKELMDEMISDYGMREYEHCFIDEGWDCYRTELNGRKMVLCDEKTSVLTKHDEYFCEKK